MAPPCKPSTDNDRLDSNQQLLHRLQTFHDTSSDWLWELDCDGTVLYSNPRVFDFLGYTAEEMLGQSIFFTIQADERDWHRQNYARLVALGQGFDKELNRNRHKKGHLVILETSAVPFFDEHGTMLGFRGTDRDVTERILQQELLSENERRLRSLMANVPGVVYRCKADEHFTVEYMSAGARELFALDPRDLYGNTGRRFKDLVHPADFQRVCQEVANSLAPPQGSGNDQFTSEYRIRDAAGREKWVWERASAVRDSQRQVIAYEGLILDITARKIAERDHKRLDQQIQQSQRLESLGILAGGIAHDFNNILMAIMGHAELALLKLSARSPGRSNITEGITASSRAADLCRQMLAYAGKASFDQVELHLGDAVQEMSHLLHTTISKKAHLVLNLDQATPAILADPSQLRQVIMNLLINASDALDEHSGTITVTTGLCTCDEDYLLNRDLMPPIPPGRYVQLVVADTGCGMDAATQSRIFDPFFTTKFAGRGLGLAAVLGIVNAHKGSLQVASQPGQGTTFTVLLPVSGNETLVAGADQQAAAPESWQGHGRMLLVDDEEGLRALGQSMLESLGFTVTTASHGGEALHALQADGADYRGIILDLTMPEMDGSETLSALRQQYPHLPVIIASGYSEEDISARFAGQGVHAFLPKPYHMALLRQVLASLPEQKTPPKTS